MQGLLAGAVKWPHNGKSTTTTSRNPPHPEAVTRQLRRQAERRAGAAPAVRDLSSLSTEELEARLLAPRSPAAVAARHELVELESTGSAEKYAMYFDDPVGFFVEVLGVEPWERQADILRAVAVHPRVAVRSGHKCGKSMSCVGLALWWICTRPRGKVVMTAPSADQVKDILWPELVKWLPKVAASLGNPEVPKDPSTGIRLADGRAIFGRTSNKPERMAGISGDQILFIIDEASGYDDSLYEPLEGNTAGGAHIVAISNPTRTVGWFYQAFKSGTRDLTPEPANDNDFGTPEWDEAQSRRERYRLIHISSEETPNAKNPDKSTHVPGLATRAYLLKMRADCGPDWGESATYLVRVKGEFPAQATDSVIGLRVVNAATERWTPADTEAALALAHGGDLTIGVDVARFGGDETVLQPVRGNYAWRPTVLSKVDGPTVAEAVVELARELRRAPHQRVRVAVDGIGVGASVVDALRSHEATRRGELAIVDVDVSFESDDGDHSNLRSQLWFGVAEWLKAGGAIPDDERLTSELLAPTYTFDSRSRKKVASKAEMKLLLKRSPDRADALALAVYRGKGRAYAYESADGVEGLRQAKASGGYVSGGRGRRGAI